MKKIILASASERRSRILSECGIDHVVVPSKAGEIMDSSMPVFEIVEINAVKKAETVASGRDKSIVIGADTLVVQGEEVLGKPHDDDEARAMMEKFSGTKIEVYTGLCVIDTVSGISSAGFEKSDLHVSCLTEEQIEKYFRLLAPYDKAGGFSIEGVGALIFDDINGSYFNILGLSMIKLGFLFKKSGLDILDYVGNKKAKTKR